MRVRRVCHAKSRSRFRRLPGPDCRWGRPALLQPSGFCFRLSSRGRRSSPGPSAPCSDLTDGVDRRPSACSSDLFERARASVKRFRGSPSQRSFSVLRRSHFCSAAKTGGNKAGAASTSLINNGVDHVDDPQSGLPVLLLGSSGGDAQAASPRHCLIYFEKGPHHAGRKILSVPGSADQVAAHPFRRQPARDQLVTACAGQAAGCEVDRAPTPIATWPSAKIRYCIDTTASESLRDQSQASALNPQRRGRIGAAVGFPCPGSPSSTQSTATASP